MYAGFPIDQVALLRCPHDQGTLFISQNQGTAANTLADATLCCRDCECLYPIREGIVRLLQADDSDPESSHERRLRDEHAEEEFACSTSQPLENAKEMGPMLSALGPYGQCRLLELGCGTGRYTVALAETGATVLAVDFSLESLRILARRLEPSLPVGLVHADATRLVLQPGSFDRCLSTLVSNLPSRQQRQAMFRAVALALHPSGRFVCGTHHQGLRAWLRSEPKVGRYSEGGIYREYFRRREIAREAQPYFARVRARPIQVGLPRILRLGLSPVIVSSIAERIPLLKHLGRLLLLEAEQPLGSLPA